MSTIDVRTPDGATSGTAARGAHIIDPRTGEAISRTGSTSQMMAVAARLRCHPVSPNRYSMAITQATLMATQAI